MRVRKKPVEVDAIQWNGHNWNSVQEFVGEDIDKVRCFPHDQTITIQTMEGVMEAKQDDIIIRGVNGELYPCKPDIFHKTYDIIGP